MTKEKIEKDNVFINSTFVGETLNDAISANINNLKLKEHFMDIGIKKIGQKYLYLCL